VDLLERDKMLVEIAQKAEPIFRKNGWEYQGRIPDSFDIFTNLDKLCNILTEKPDLKISCGRFTVFYKNDKLTIVPDFEMEL
jgi:hypothetical protein